MIPILIPVSDFSVTGHQELRYTLRSLANLTGVGEVTIIGHKPKWITNVNHIWASDDPQKRYKERNILYKLLKSPYERFLYVMDDNYIIERMSAPKFPYYWKIATYRGPYATTMQRTLAITGKDYDLHCPMLMDRKGLEKLNELDWSVPFGYGVKSLYCHYAGIQGQQALDMKIDTPLSRGAISSLVQGRKWFSSGDQAFQGEMRGWLLGRFPEKSKYEI